MLLALLEKNRKEEKRKMEITKSTTFLLLLLLVSSSLLSSSIEAVCVPRNSSTAAPSPGPVAAPGPATSKPQRKETLSSTLSASDSDSSSSSFDTPNLPFHLPHPVLKQICDKTDYPEVCLASVAPFVTGNVDPVSVLKMGIQALEKVFHKGIELAKSIYNSSSATGKDNLDTCIESYESGLGDVQSALEAIAGHDMGRLNSMLSATITYSTTCEDGFSSMDMVSPMQELDEYLTKLGSNSLAIANLLRWN